MANLRAVESGQERRETAYRGVAVQVGTTGQLGVNVNGNVIAAKWADPVVVAAGDPVLVTISTGRSGGSEAIVRARLADRPRPGRGTVKTVPPSSPTVTVTGTDGTDYVATFVSSYTPVVGHKVLLSWNAAVPSIQGEVSVTAAPYTPPPTAVVAPPATVTSGEEHYPATDSDTWWPSGGWGSWAGGGGRVYQGDYGSGPLTGAYFYGGAVSQLQGKIITRLRIILGSRLAVGSNNAAVVVHFYAHTSANKPGGDVSRVIGPFDVVANPGQGLWTYDLPPDLYGPTLINGGGIAIYGNPYAGFKGRREEPEAGKLIVNWSL